VRVVAGKTISAATPAHLRMLDDHRGRALIDVGAGDARTTYRYARANPDRLVIGLDPAWPRMSETATRAARKPAKGGAPNLLLVSGSIEIPSPELTAIASDVWVLLPWGRLLHGVVLGEADICGGLAAVAGTGARLEIRVGTSIWRKPVPREIEGLPEMTPEYVEQELAPRLAVQGWQVTATELMDTETATVSGSSWARRLSAGPTEQIIQVLATRTG
jgi:16S rRNA (adenine(1408)-N(1))-methyltransferase